MSSRLFTFVGGAHGRWSVLGISPVVGDPLPATATIDVVNGPVPVLPDGAAWALRGVTSNARYVTQEEKVRLVAVQVDPGRPDATLAALIPIRKNAAWWDLPQDERRKILEDRSHHITTGMKYLPAIARRLHH
jgi:hypothetical protein